MGEAWKIETRFGHDGKEGYVQLISPGGVVVTSRHWPAGTLRSRQDEVREAYRYFQKMASALNAERELSYLHKREAEARELMAKMLPKSYISYCQDDELALVYQRAEAWLAAHAEAPTGGDDGNR